VRCNVYTNVPKSLDCQRGYPILRNECGRPWTRRQELRRGRVLAFLQVVCWACDPRLSCLQAICCAGAGAGLRHHINRSFLAVLIARLDSVVRDRLPYFCDEVVNGIPCKGTVGDSSPPSHQVCRLYVGMCVEVICNRYFVVLERRRYEANPEQFVVDA